MNRMALRPLFAFVSLLILNGSGTLLAGDWPQWKANSTHTNKGTDAPPVDLKLNWVRELPPLTAAWPDQPLIPFDVSYEPVVVGHTLLVGSSREDGVLALDTRTGKELWRFSAGGPVRFAPTCAHKNAYIACDDGYLYCIKIETGEMVWKLRGGPSDRKLLGNGRLISTWPARGAPVVDGDVVYFAASIWPFMGIFIHAVDAHTGQIKWTNDGDGSMYIKQPHSAESFAGIAPQGHMSIQGDKLFIAGGRSIPACYDKRTGKVIYYHLNENSKKGGGHSVTLAGKFFFNGTAAFRVEDGKFLSEFSSVICVDGEKAYVIESNELRVYILKEVVKPKDVVKPPKPPKPEGGTKPEKPEADPKKEDPKKVALEEGWSFVSDDPKPVDPKADPKKEDLKRFTGKHTAATPAIGMTQIIKAGEQLIVAGPKKLRVHSAEDIEKVLWEADFEGVPFSIITADERIFISTVEGKLLCFGPDAGTTKLPTHFETLPRTKVLEKLSPVVQQLLKTTPEREGYLLLAKADLDCIRDLAASTNFHILALEPKTETLESMKKTLIQEGIYGTRCALILGDMTTAQMPAYLINLAYLPEGSTLETIERSYRSLRPYGGKLVLGVSKDKLETIKTLIEALNLAKVKITPSESTILLERDGAIPGAANWTHEHADAANTRVSKDTVVKTPLGVLWFGGTSHDGILPRHGHGPQPQVCDGRIFIEGVDKMRAVDLYTGRLLWEAQLPGLGDIYNNLAHQAGANASGANYVSSPEGIYIAYLKKCVCLDPATGKIIKEYKLPKEADTEDHPRWSFISLIGDYLIGGADPEFDAALEKQSKTPSKLLKLWENDNFYSSKQISVLDRKTGKVLWTAHAELGFRNNSICAGGDRLFVIDRLSGSAIKRLEGGKLEVPASIVSCYSLKDGKRLWTSNKEVFGTWLSYSEKHDVLLESGRVARDTLSDEPKGVRGWNATKGEAIWFDKTFTGPAMIRGDTVLQGQGACDILTGKPIRKIDPVTGELVEWKWLRHYGCNTPAASENLLTFRSGAAGFYDLCNDGGTGNFGGFRSSCTMNLIVAGGVLSVPDYTRTCTCSYQNQTSIALIPMEENEMWTFVGKADYKTQVKQIGINFGAAGDRKADNNTMWLEFPSVGGLSPIPPATVTGAKVRYLRRHPSTVTGEKPWVGSSAVIGAENITIKMGPTNTLERSYTVRLYFCELENAKEGERVFSGSLQGRRLLTDYDITKKANGSFKIVVEEFRGVRIAEEFRLSFRSASKSLPPMISGIELIEE